MIRYIKQDFSDVYYYCYHESCQQKKIFQVIQSGHGQDYHEFYNTFTGTGFFLIINLAEVDNVASFFKTKIYNQFSY